MPLIKDVVQKANAKSYQSIECARGAFKGKCECGRRVVVASDGEIVCQNCGAVHGRANVSSARAAGRDHVPCDHWSGSLNNQEKQLETDVERRDGGEHMSKLFTLTEKQLQRFRKIAVFGDLHGDYEALRSGLSIVDPAEDGIIFLGDCADRGPSGIEVIDSVDWLIRNHPGSVFALKGNHEDYTESGEPEFWPCTLIDEAREKRGDWHNYFHSTFEPFVDRLGIAAIVPGETLFVHGGVSSKIKSLKDLEQPTRDVERDILWSDPFEGYGERENTRGDGLVEFGVDVTAKVCGLLGVKRIVRSHEPAKALKGPFYSHNQRVITISSTSAYGGEPFILSIQPADISRVSVVYLTRATQ